MIGKIDGNEFELIAKSKNRKNASFSRLKIAKIVSNLLKDAGFNDGNMANEMAVSLEMAGNDCLSETVYRIRVIIEPVQK